MLSRACTAQSGPARFAQWASESDIKKAFQSGDDDGDNTLSVSEACTALEKLTGRSIGSDTVESTCSKCGVVTSREMDFDEFVTVVRDLEGNGETCRSSSFKEYAGNSQR